MVTLLDEYVGEFIRDIGRSITGVVSLVEFVLGVSYFCGQKLAEWIVATYLVAAEIGSQTWEFILVFGSDLWDFGAGIVRGFLLIYYGICMFFEAFYMGAKDIQALSIHVFSSVGESLNNTQSAVVSEFARAFTDVPTHICDSLVFIGDSAIFLGTVFQRILQDFCAQLVLAPFNVFRVITNVMYNIACFPVYISDQMPIAAHVGLAVIALILGAYWKLNLFSLFKKIPYAFKKMFKWICKICVFLKNSKRIAQEIVKSGGSYRSSSRSPSKDTKALCVICQDATVSFISMPCKHVCLCLSCVKTLVDFDNRCPLCRGAVTRFEKVYIPM